MAFRLMPLLLLAALLPARAETLPDPTRPAVVVGEEGMEQVAPAAAPRLQMIRIAPGRRTALVDGREVTVGSRVGDMRVVRITEGEVVLRGPGGTEVLRLFADVEKRPATASQKTTGARAPRKAQR